MVLYIYKYWFKISSNIYRPTINSTGPNLKTTLMIINSNHQNSKHDDVPNIMWTCQLCSREDQNASKKTKRHFILDNIGSDDDDEDEDEEEEDSDDDMEYIEDAIDNMILEFSRD
jgi:hypothetical protein